MRKFLVKYNPLKSFWQFLRNGIYGSIAFFTLLASEGMISVVLPLFLPREYFKYIVIGLIGIKTLKNLLKKADSETVKKYNKKKNQVTSSIKLD